MNLAHRTRLILDAITTAREQLAAYGDDSWLNIDHSGPEAEAMPAVKAHFALQAAIREFARSCTLIEEHIHTGLDQLDPAAAAEIRQPPAADRTIVALDRTQEHRLTEDFTYKRPWAIRLGDAQAVDLTTWKAMYGWVIDTLRNSHGTLIESLPDGDLALTKRGRPMFAHNPGEMVAPMRNHDLFYETNLSANDVARQITLLIQAAGIELNDCGVYLREDRDA